MYQTSRHIGVFDIFDLQGTIEQVRTWLMMGHNLDTCPALVYQCAVPNLIMASQKLIMANSVYPRIDKLVITSQTSTPQDSETSYSGTIYTTVAADEFYRSGDVNPYQVAWNIGQTVANGSWGSFCLITSGNQLINRALAGVTKASGTSKIVQFTGEVR